MVTVAGLIISYLFLDSYHMEWTMVKESQDPVNEEIKDHLLSLGLPEDILNDLAEEDLLECKNARQVFVERDDYPMNRISSERTEIERSSDRTGAKRPVEGDPSFLVE